jgi:hypothetical protein
MNGKGSGKKLEAEERRLALERDLSLARQLEFERRVQERRAQDSDEDEYEEPPAAGVPVPRP